MSHPDVQLPHLHDAGDVETARYQTLSVPAVLGLALGLCGGVALAEPAFWPLPAAGLGVSALALWRIARSDRALGGRPLAVAGLCLSAAFFAAALAQRWTYQWHLRHEARQVAQSWFEYLRHDCPIAAYAMGDSPGRSWPREGVTLAQWEAEVRGDPHRAEALKAFETQPAVHKLLAFGEKAHAHFCRAEGGADDSLRLVYSITADDTEENKPFFVALVLMRQRHTVPEPSTWRLGQADWSVLDVQQADGPGGTP